MKLHLWLNIFDINVNIQLKDIVYFLPAFFHTESKYALARPPKLVLLEISGALALRCLVGEIQAGSKFGALGIVFFATVALDCA